MIQREGRFRIGGNRFAHVYADQYSLAHIRTVITTHGIHTHIEMTYVIVTVSKVYKFTDV